MRRATPCRTTCWSAAPRPATASSTSTTSRASGRRSTGTTPSAMRPEQATSASDDSDLRSIAHIGTIVSTCAIAMAERTGAGGRDVLGAMVLGYEIAGRVDEALTPGRGERGFHGSISTIFGGAVAAGTLLG